MNDASIRRLKHDLREAEKRESKAMQALIDKGADGRDVRLLAVTAFEAGTARVKLSMARSINDVLGF